MDWLWPSEYLVNKIKMINLFQSATGVTLKQSYYPKSDIWKMRLWGGGLILCQWCHINMLYLQCKGVILLTARPAPQTRSCGSCDVFSACSITINNYKLLQKEMSWNFCCWCAEQPNSTSSSSCVPFCRKGANG